MGEKIRDLHSIKIGKASFMIELNEGTHPGERLIHIQNPKFRYLLREKEFFHLSSMVMRAWREFEYIKEKAPAVKKEEDFPPREPVSPETYEAAGTLNSCLAAEKAEHRILDIQNKMITLIIQQDHADRAEQILAGKGWKKIFHPYGTEYGYQFLYQLRPFTLFRREDMYLEIYSQLPCASLSPKQWIPLDKKIQRQVWTDPTVSDGIDQCNMECRYIYHLCWAVFFNKGFSKFEKEFILGHKDLLHTDTMKELLDTVFFHFTDTLIDHIGSGKTDEIIPAYFSFRNY